MVSSTVVPQVQAVFQEGALTKKIKVGLQVCVKSFSTKLPWKLLFDTHFFLVKQAQPIPSDLVAKMLGNRVAVSPIVTVEPRRRKFHKPITLTIPVPQAAAKGMINQYSGDTPTLRLLCSITGSTKSGTLNATILLLVPFAFYLHLVNVMILPHSIISLKRDKK